VAFRPRINASDFWRPLLGVAFTAALGGCVPLPYSGSEPVEDFSSRLPADLLERSDDALVLIQTATKSEGLVEELSEPPDERTKRAVTARFFKAYELRTLHQRLSRKSGSGVVLLSAPPYPAELPFTASTRLLSRVCVLAPDGREIAIDFDGAKQTDGVRLLDAGRRAAIVSALQTADAMALEKVEGPCGVAGETRWDAHLRARVAAYIAAVPTAAPAAESSELGRLLAGGWQQAAARIPPAGSLLLLAGTSWRGTKSAEPPIFLAGIGFDRARAAVQATSEADIVRLLPSMASGTRAVHNVSLERFCVISDDGRVLRWNKETTGWEAFDPTPAWAPKELAMMREDRPGPACLPRGSRAWPAPEHGRVVAFIGGVRPANGRQAAAEAQLRRLLVGAQRAAQATHMLVATDTSGPDTPRVVPLFLEGGDDATLVRGLRSISPAEFAGAVASPRAADAEMVTGFRPDELCLISAAGTFVAFQLRQVPDWMSPQDGWNASEPKERERALGEWRAGAIKALDSESDDYSDPDLCRLGAHRSWPPSLRNAVVRFLERLPDARASVRGGALSGRLAATINGMLTLDRAQRPIAAEILANWQSAFRNAVNRAHE
jgi:hypothetical protein